MFQAMIAVVLLASPDEAGGGKKGVYLNSVLLIGPDAHVSLLNHGDEEVDVSGWSLNHEVDAAKKGDWTFPDGTTIGAGESLVIANSADGYEKARSKAPDFELVRGDGVADNDDVPNLDGSDGAKPFQAEESGGALTLRDTKGTLVNHVGFRPEPPEHLMGELNAWNEIRKPGELGRLTGSPGAGEKAANEGMDETAAAEEGGAEPVKKAGGAADVDAVGEGLKALEDQAEVKREAAANEVLGQDNGVDGAPSGDSMWLWLSILLAIGIGFFVWRRRDA